MKTFFSNPENLASPYISKFCLPNHSFFFFFPPAHLSLAVSYSGAARRSQWMLIHLAIKSSLECLQVYWVHLFLYGDSFADYFAAT